MHKALKFAGGSLLLGAFGWTTWQNRRLFYVHDVTSGESTAYPSLRSRIYYATPSDALQAAEQAISGLSGWEIVKIDRQNQAIDAAAVFGFRRLHDEVTVYVQARSEDQTRVVIRSSSSGRGGDLGRNAAHIKVLQSRMDAILLNGSAI